jgi:hypothetical protein
MHRHADVVPGFPTARIRSYSGGLPVEVVLLAQLGPGAGDRLHADTGALQRAHPGFVDALDEPSVRIAAPDFDAGERSALYTFTVGAMGHPFHRHAGHRTFTAVTGSGGARLRFSTASDEQIARDPAHFAAALHHVDLPPDALFSVRFGGGTWHQFAPLQAGSPHPVLFALSCHTDELGGLPRGALQDQVFAGEANIATLTETLPPSVQAWLAAHPAHVERVPTVRLALHAPPDSWQQHLCTSLRARAGRLRSRLAGWYAEIGFVEGRASPVKALPSPPSGSFLLEQLPGFHHQDTFSLRLQGTTNATASALMADVLEGFLQSRPAGVTQLMRLRNALVRPLRLRTSPLGCPVSSLLSTGDGPLFAGRYPVLAQRIDADGQRAQVILGADDRHLAFRSCVGVQITDTGVEITLGTRVRCANVFGRAYMAAISGVHHAYIAPAMLRMAVEGAVQRHAPLSLAQGLFA